MFLRWLAFTPLACRSIPGVAGWAVVVSFEFAFDTAAVVSLSGAAAVAFEVDVVDSEG